MNSVLSYNLGSGLALKSPFFKVDACQFDNNTVAGLSYDPHFTEQDAYQLRSFMTITKTLDFKAPEWKLSMQTSGYEFIAVTAKTVSESKTYRVQLETAIRERLVVQVSQERSRIGGEKLEMSSLKAFSYFRNHGLFIPSKLAVYIYKPN